MPYCSGEQMHLEQGSSLLSPPQGSVIMHQGPEEGLLLPRTKHKISWDLNSPTFFIRMRERVWIDFLQAVDTLGYRY